MPKSAKAFRTSLKKNGVFYTPKKLAEFMRSFFPQNVPEIYDPTCGDGALLAEFPDAKKFGQEIDAEQAAYARERFPGSEIAAGDTLEDNKFKWRKFKYIIGNPPFSVAWTPKNDERFEGFELAPKSKADYAFVLHSLHMLEDDGVCVLMLFPGVLYRGNAEGKIRKRLVELNWVESVTAVDGGDFDDTGVSTVVVVFRKNREARTVKFTDRKLGESRDVSLEEIAGNGYTLSVNNYLVADLEKPETDPLAEQMKARTAALKHFRASLEVDALVCWLEHYRDGFQPLDFIDDLQKILNDAKRKLSEKGIKRDGLQTELFTA